MKICTRCKNELLISEFTTKTGNVTSRCKKCLSEIQLKWLEKNKERVNRNRVERKKTDKVYHEKSKEQKRRSYEKNKEKYALKFKEYRKKNPEKVKVISKRWKSKNKKKLCVHAKVKYRIDRGIIIKPLVCDNCGNLSKLEAHHEDYEKPFQIKWLCVPCHGRTRKMKIEGGDYPLP